MSALATTGLAQLTPSASGESPMTKLDRAFKALRQHPTMQVTLAGSETTGSQSVALWVQATTTTSWTQGGFEVRQSHVVEYRGNALRQQVVGDGKVFFAYEPAKKQVVVANYAASGQDPSKNLDRFIAGIRKLADNQAALAVRLLGDIGGWNGQTLSWTPGYPPEYIEMSARVDPVNPGRTYVADASRYYIFFGLGNPARRTVVFEMDANDNLQRAFFNESGRLGTRNRLTEWTATFTPNPPLAAGFYTFVAPSNAVQVAGPNLGN